MGRIRGGGEIYSAYMNLWAVGECFWERERRWMRRRESRDTYIVTGRELGEWKEENMDWERGEEVVVKS